MARYLYRKPVAAFIEDMDAKLVPAMLVSEYHRLTEEHASESERLSWSSSLQALADVLRVDDLRQSHIIVELFMPIGGRRCDAVLSGRDRLGKANAVVIELKQWSQVQPGPYEEHVVSHGRVLLHPSAQVRSYVEHLRCFHSAFVLEDGDPIGLQGCAWLHEMTPGPLALLRDHTRFAAVKDCPVFGLEDVPLFRDWLRSWLLPGPATPVAERIASGVPVPSPRLLDLLVNTINRNHEWNLLDEQRTVYMAVRSAVQIARDTREKTVVVVRGGPGTGKSVLAIQLLAHAARQSWRVVHATGSKAFQTVLQGKTLEISQEILKRAFGPKKKYIPVDGLFTTFASVARAGKENPDSIELMVADEAHRLWEHRRIKFPNGTVRWLTDTPMIDEVIRASLVSVFFLDDNQSVRPGEIGRSSMIVDHARRMGVRVEEFDLNMQFRCNGSESYVNWVEGALGLRPDNDLDWARYAAYDFRVLPDAASIAHELDRYRKASLSSRMVAGYCWGWHKPDALGVLPHDLVDPRFGGWTGAWIEKTGKDLAPLDHQYYKWATMDSHAEQVGSIYSVQGFEFDYVGVIWGEDLVRRGDRWVAQLDRNKDGAFKKELRLSGADPVEKLLNVYRVLMTRGMRGTLLTVLDAETRAYLEWRLHMPLRAVG